MISKFTTQYKRVLQRAYNIAKAEQAREIKVHHLLTALIKTQGSLAFELLHKLGLINLKPRQRELISDQASYNIDFSNLNLSSKVKKVIKLSVLAAAKYDHQYIGTEHLLQGLLSEDKQLMEKFLEKKNYSVKDFSGQLKAVMKNTSKFSNLTISFNSGKTSPEQLVKTKTKSKIRRQPRKKERLLDYFATDLTDASLQEKINPVIGRQAEIARIIQILARRDKNNPVLLGEPGVGKTAIIEGLGKKIFKGEVPDILINKKIYNLDLSLLVAGAVYRGEFESRLKQLLDEIKEDGNIILFVDELHNIVGAGSAMGSMDAANILKPALARGEIRLIGATTFEEYKKYIEIDTALERRLQPVIVAEPSIQETVEILKGIRPAYEKHHKVLISDEALSSAAEMSYRYLREKFLPDKAIDLIDEAAAKIKVKTAPQKENQIIKNIESQLQGIIEAKKKAVEQENFPRALALKEQEKGLMDSLDRLENEVQTKTARMQGRITHEHIAGLISQITRIPVGELEALEVNKLKNLSQHLSRKIVGQAEAIESLTQAIKRSKTGLADKDKPLGSFMFLGPSGVGKTETAKVLASEVFHNEKSLIRFDMSEFAEGFNISRLLGAPAGYVGFREGGQLTEQVRRNPYSVILFDEIEKAHPEIFNILLQILDSGHLSDATGKQVDFRNTIIILTSNIGLMDFNRGAEIGFASEKDQQKKQEAEQQYSEIKESVITSLRRSFRPEFLNRLDKIIVFKPLTLDSIKQIVSLEIDKLSLLIKDQNINLKADTKLIKLIAEKSFTPQEGARAINRVLQDLVMAPLADKILSKEIKPGQIIKLSAEKGEVTFN